MKYIDHDGIPFESETSQDKLLETLYTHLWGRLILKPLVTPKFSQFVGKLLSTKLSTLFIDPFVKSNHIDLSEYKDCKYQSYNEFFCREIKDGARPLAGDANTLISPADGKVTVYPITENTTFSIKHTEYTLRTLLSSKRLAARYKGGYAFVVRLTVDDYHRYCYAANGTKSKNYKIPGILHTVNPIANDYTPIYKENAREYTVLHTKEFGDIIQMEVGAMMVGKIKNHDEEATVLRGEEKGYFEFGGSTVIVLVKKDRIHLRDDLLENTLEGYETKVYQGEKLGVRM